VSFMSADSAEPLTAESTSIPDPASMRSGELLDDDRPCPSYVGSLVLSSQRYS